MPVRGPRLKKIRRLGTQLPGLTRKSADKKPQPPGAHGAKPSRRRPSEYRRRLEEKQKVRFNYGVTERQMHGYVERARSAPGPTGENLLALLERRLDNVVFRLGIAPTIPAARQLIAHGHVRVGDHVVDKAGYEVDMGDVVSLTPSARASAERRGATCEPSIALPSYLERDSNDPCTGGVVSLPARSDTPFPVREAMIVEFYAR
ncbi:MAG TPA: 30S ribosomal protein S4 [Gemmatimonadaceae bacterium]